MERAPAERTTPEPAVEPTNGQSALGTPTVLTAATALALQRSIGNRNVVRIARAPAPTAIEPLSPGMDDIETYTDIAQNYRLGAIWLKQDIKGMDPDSEMVKRAAELIELAEAQAGNFIQGGEKPYDKGWAEGVRAGLDEIRQMRRELTYEKDAPKREAIAKAAAEAKRLVAEYKKLEPKLLDAARAAFRSDDDSLKALAEFLDKYGTELDIGLGLFEMSRDITSALAKAKNLDVPPIGKLAAGLAKLNKGISAVNLALSMRGEAGRTELDKGINGIGFAAGAFSSLGTLFGASAHIGLYANLYLVPLTKACLEGVAKLGEHMHDQNKTWVEAFGAPGNYMVEPGGEPMWRYMTSVMKAKGDTSVAEPSDEVAEYFMEHRGLFDTGVNATAAWAAMPTSGIWGLKKLDKAKFKEWIFRNRHAVWAMLYGSMKTGKQ